MPSFRDVSSDAVFRDVSSMPSLETSRRMPLAFCAVFRGYPDFFLGSIYSPHARIEY